MTGLLQVEPQASGRFLERAPCRIDGYCRADNVRTLGEISIIIASGGTRSAFLTKLLASYIPKNLRLTLSDELGISTAFKEAIKFAVLSRATVNHFANNIPAASQFAILGKLVLPPRMAKV